MSEIIALTANHPRSGNISGGGKFPSSWPAFSRIRLIYFCFTQLQQRKRAEERRENESSALLKKFMISHTHSQACSLPDTTALISRPENWLDSHS